MKSFELPATMHLDTPELVDLANSIFLQARIKGVLTILNKIPSTEMENYLRIALLERGLEPIGVIHEDSTFNISWLKGKSLALNNLEQVIQQVVKRLEAEEVSYEAQLF